MPKRILSYLPPLVYITTQSCKELKAIKYPRSESIEINGIIYTKYVVQSYACSLGSWIVPDCDFSEQNKKTVIDWIKEYIIPRKSPNYYQSYFLKHILEKNTGIYTYAGQFEYAMLATGFVNIRNWYDVNLHFSISQKSPALNMLPMG